MKRCSSICSTLLFVAHLVALLVAAGSTAISQITITETDLQDILMNSTRISRTITYNPDPIVHLGVPDPSSQSFDFSGLTDVSTDDSVLTEYVDPSGQLGASEFPTANLCAPTAITDSAFSITTVLYLRLQADGLYQLGVVVRQQLPLLSYDTTIYEKHSPPQLLIPLPLTYGTTRTGIDTVVTDSSNEQFTVTTTSMVCDGWGDITYPAGALAGSAGSALGIRLTDCLRATLTRVEESYTGEFFNGREKTVEVTFLSLDGSILAVSQSDTLYAGGNAEVNSLDYSFKPGTPTDVRPVTAALPGGYALSQNYPNPFNPSTTIAFSIPAAGQVTLTVFDLLGREVATLVDRRMAPGSYEASFDAAGLPSGLYIARIVSGSYVGTRKMNVVK